VELDYEEDISSAKDHKDLTSMGDEEGSHADTNSDQYHFFKDDEAGEDNVSESNTDAGRDLPFDDLKILNISNTSTHNGQLCAPVVYSLKTIHLLKTGALEISKVLHFPYLGLATNLQTIEITKVNLNMQIFEKIITTEPELHGLKALIVREMGWIWEDRPWNKYDFSRMSEAVVSHLPELQRSEGSRNKYDREWGRLRPFGSFKKLEKLVDLTVDYELITS
jgi:hypothetical protein